MKEGSVIIIPSYNNSAEPLNIASCCRAQLSTRVYSLRDPLSLSVALFSPPNSSAFFSLQQSSSPVPDIIAASGSKTPTPYQISTTPHQPQRVSSSTAASQLVPDPQSYLFVCIRNNMRIRETLRETLHTPLCSSSCCWSQFINSFRTSIYLHSPKPLLCNLTLGTPRCTSMQLSGTILQMWQTEERHRRHPGLPDSTCLGAYIRFLAALIIIR
jgi:hypothetical protein